MGCERICKFCEHADHTRERNGLIRCLKKHTFVLTTSSCELHSFHFTMDDETVKELMKAFGRRVHDEKVQT